MTKTKLKIHQKSFSCKYFDESYWDMMTEIDDWLDDFESSKHKNIIKVKFIVIAIEELK